ncbi:hypothetical protein GOODEAATRI_024084 [Goodea atripinnis]|uniref:Uncharacterized protein n=1 Tax=Goodea atripinnis TaxID=208336 RepID=A0ABV0NX97_9TELE
MESEVVAVFTFDLVGQLENGTSISLYLLLSLPLSVSKSFFVPRLICCSFVPLFVCTSIYTSICLPFCLYVPPSVCTLFCLYIHLIEENQKIQLLAKVQHL